MSNTKLRGTCARRSPSRSWSRLSAVPSISHEPAEGVRTLPRRRKGPMTRSSRTRRVRASAAPARSSAATTELRNSAGAAWSQNARMPCEPPGRRRRRCSSSCRGHICEPRTLSRAGPTGARAPPELLPQLAPEGDEIEGELDGFALGRRAEVLLGFAEELGIEPELLAHFALAGDRAAGTGAGLGHRSSEQCTDETSVVSVRRQGFGFGMERPHGPPAAAGDQPCGFEFYVPLKRARLPPASVG